MALGPIQTGSRSNPGVVASYTVSLANPVKAGSLIVVAASASVTTTTISVADNLGNTYNTLFASLTGASAPCGFFYAKSIASGACTITVTHSLANATGNCIVREYLAAAESYFDVTANASATSTNPTSAATATSAATSCLVIGAAATNSTNPLSVGAGYSNLLVLQGTNVVAMEDKEISTPAAQTAAFGTGFTPSWTCVVAVFNIKRLTNLNNYQFISVGDGMSVSEKIR